MSGFDFPYMAFITVEQHTIALTEQSVYNGKPGFKREVDEERRFEIEIDEILIGEICLFAWHQPRISISSSHLVVWGGTRVYIVPLTGGTLHLFQQKEEVHAAYPVGNLWCFVCELSVRLFDPAKGVEVARFAHHEVLMRSWWSGDSLVVEDFEGRRMRFQSLAVGSELSPQYE